MFYEEEKYRDNSPFFQAIKIQSVIAIEMFCDFGADISTTTASGKMPLIYSAQNDFDEICMYLSLRINNVNVEDWETGYTVLVLYILKENLFRTQQLIMRGANVNHHNRKGFTPLHIAIERNVSRNVIEWLLDAGADPHIEDIKGLDCCDKVHKSGQYP